MAARTAARPRSGSRRPRDSRDRSLLYFFCVLEAGTPAHALLRRREVPGMEPGAPLFPLEAAGLVAAVSEVPAARFGEEPLNALLADLQSVAPLAFRHDEAVRTLAEAAPALIPITFGAVYQSQERVCDLLRARGQEFRRLLTHVHGKREWGLKIFADLARLRRAVESGDERLQEMAEDANAAGPGRAYLLNKRLERESNLAVDRRAEEIVAEVLSHLADVSAASRVEQPQAPRQDDVRLIGKAAFLVGTSDAESFQERVSALERQCSRLGMRLELSGPWAPYSFATPDAPPERDSR